MRFASKSRFRPAISMTSMLDVIFLLLFYFAARSVQAQWEADIKVTLPQAKNADSAGRQIGEQVINVRNGEPDTVVINDMKLTFPELEKKLAHLVQIDPDQAVVIRGDAAVAYSNLVKVVDTCTGAGIYNYRLATRHETAAEEKGVRK